MSSAIEKNPPYPKNFANEFLVIDRGEGVYLYDRTEKKYLDFGSGIAVNSLGYGREDFTKIISHQAKKLIHISNLYATEPAMDLARKMTNTRNFSAVHFGNSGSEANEAAIKYARIYSLRTKGEGHHKILSFSNGFHGRTMGSLSATSKEAYKKPFYPLVPGFYETPFNDVEALTEILDETFAAVIIEPLQGEGGLTRATHGFSHTLNELCSKFNIIQIADEVQTGLGRLGMLYASDLVGLEPDIITLSKPLAAGLPLSATLIPEKINNLIKLGEHGGTFGGGPVTTALASYVWDILSDEDFLQNVRSKGQFLEELLEGLCREIDGLVEVRGYGLLRGITVEKNPSENIPKIMARCREKGLLVLRSGQNVLRIAPPLVIENEQLEEGVALIKETCKEIL